LLVATPLLRDPNFDRTVVLMLEHSDVGALGVVLNRPSPLGVADAIDDWADVAVSPKVVFIGGPVETGSVIALARRRTEPEPESFTEVLGPIGVIDISLDAALLAASLDGVRIFTGYAGWGPGQLEGEIDESAWWVVDAAVDDVLSTDPDELWHAVLARQPDRELRKYAHFPDDVRVN
jgi:putative transcriptional regulator